MNLRTSASGQLTTHAGWKNLACRVLLHFFFIQQIHATMRMTMMTVTMLLGCLWFHVLFLPKYASVLKLGKALGSTLLFSALTLHIQFCTWLAKQASMGPVKTSSSCSGSSSFTWVGWLVGGLVGHTMLYVTWQKLAVVVLIINVNCVVRLKCSLESNKDDLQY